MKDKDGFTLKVKTSKNGGGTVFFNSLVLTTFIFKSLDIYENTKFNISREPCPKSFKYAIITRAQKRGRKPNPQ